MHFAQIRATKIEEEKAEKLQQKERRENKKLYGNYVKNFDILQFGKCYEPWVMGAKEKTIKNDNEKLENFFKFNDKDLSTAFLEKLIKEYEESFFDSSFYSYRLSSFEEYKNLGTKVVEFSTGTNAPKRLINKFKKCLANIELASEEGWYEKQKQRILSNDFNSVAEIKRRQEILSYNIIRLSRGYFSSVTAHQSMVTHNASVPAIEHRYEGGVQGRFDGATRWVQNEEPTPYYAGTNQVAYNAPQRNDRAEKEYREAAQNCERYLLALIDEALAHKEAMTHPKNKVMKQFLATSKVHKDLVKIYKGLEKVDKESLKNPIKVLVGFREAKLSV